MKFLKDWSPHDANDQLTEGLVDFGPSPGPSAGLVEFLKGVVRQDFLYGDVNSSPLNCKNII